MPVPKWASILEVFLIVFFALSQSILVKPAYAISCLFYGDEIMAPLLGTTTAALTVTNSGPETATVVKFVNADGPEFFQITGGSAPGWIANLEGGEIIFTGGTLEASQGASFSVQIKGLAETEGSYYTIDALVSTNGSVMQGCSGGRNVSVETFFTIQDLAISASSTSATISWHTSSSANSNVKYGKTPSYGQTATNGNLVSSHKIVLTGLTPRSTYYYSVTSVDGVGHAVESGRNTFTTTPPPPTPTPTPPPASAPAETVPPSISLTTNFSKPFETAPEVKGKASDNKAIATIEYSTDGGVNWLPVDKITAPGGKSTEFSFIPILFDDGNYQIVVRATDSSENQGVSKTYTLVIDRLPPIVGSALISVGPLVLTPNQNGQLITVAGVEHKVTLSVAGGPTSVDLLVNDHIHSFSRSSETGLWNGVAVFEEPGSYELIAKSEDGGGNVTERRLVTVTVLDSGTVGTTAEGTITVYGQEPASQVWHPWDARSFGQTNPQSFRDGTYSLFLPPGTYYLKVSALGYQTVTSNIFHLNSPTPVNTDFALEKTGRFNFFHISFRSQEVTIAKPELSAEPNPLLDQLAPIFFLPALEGNFESLALRGHASVLSFVNTWSDSSVEQISILNRFPRPNQIGTVVVQDNLSRVEVFAKRGGYDLELAVDQDGQLVDDFDIFTLPTHIFLDRRGIIKRIVPGVLNVEEIERNLLEIL